MVSVLVLGSGTSSGVPVIACTCSVCVSEKEKNKRLRSSILINFNNSYYVLIDSGPDFRTQAINYKIPRIDAVFYTHAHADHIFGLDDIRMYNFKQKTGIPIYGEEDTLDALKRCFNYCFTEDPNYEGGGIPKLTLNKILPYESISLISSELSVRSPLIKSLFIKSLRVNHGRLPILGYKIGKFAYLTDCSSVPKETEDLLSDVEILMISGLRHKEHKTHFTINQAKEFALKNNIPRTYITHVAHDIEHYETDLLLKEETNDRVRLCFDGLRFEI